MANRNITIDRQNKAIVPYNGSLATLTPFYQTNTETFQIQVVDPSGDPFSPWTVVDYSGADLRFQLSRRATGTSGDDDDFFLVRALESDWTWSASDKWWTGSVNFNTAAVTSFLAGAGQQTAILEITVVTASRTTLYRSEVELRANV